MVPFLRYQLTGTLLVPLRVDLDGDEVVGVGLEIGDQTGATVDEDCGSRVVKVKKTLLSEFVALSDSDAATIVAFAGRWGLLGLCKHGLPAGHSQMPRSLTPEVYVSLRHVLFCAPDNREKIQAWHAYSSYFQSITGIAAMLHQGSVVADDQWQIVRPSHIEADVWRVYHGIALSAQKKALASIVTACSDAAGLLPALSWTKSKPELQIGGRFSDTLFAVLAEQLILSISRSEMALCSYCRSVYLPQRKPKAGQKNYCPRCRGANIPVILALRAARERSKGELHGKKRSK